MLERSVAITWLEKVDPFIGDKVHDVECAKCSFPVGGDPARKIFTELVVEDCKAPLRGRWVTPLLLQDQARGATPLPVQGATRSSRRGPAPLEGARYSSWI